MLLCVTAVWLRACRVDGFTHFLHALRSH